MERMEREKRRHKSATPECPGHPVKDQKEQERAGDMEEDIDEMHAARVDAEQVDVQHVGEPGQRMPVARINGCEGPLGAVDRQSGQNMPVFNNVHFVVEIDKIEVIDLPEDREGHNSQDKADNGFSGRLRQVDGHREITLTFYSIHE